VAYHTQPSCQFQSFWGFLPESDYVTFGSLLSQIRLSSVHPTQGVEAFDNISSVLCTLAIL